jgi:hypothetical protein
MQQSLENLRLSGNLISRILKRMTKKSSFVVKFDEFFGCSESFSASISAAAATTRSQSSSFDRVRSFESRSVEQIVSIVETLREDLGESERLAMNLDSSSTRFDPN